MVGMVDSALRSDVHILLGELKRIQNLETGKHFHAEAIKFGHDSSIYVVSALVSMYSRCGSMEDACQVFNSIKYPNVVSWTALILGYANNGQGFTALNLFLKMKSGGITPDALTFVAALKACTSLAVEGTKLAECRIWGKVLFNLLFYNGCYLNIYVQNTLIDMYGKCGSMVDAHQVFNSIQHPDLVSWTALILGYAENEQGSISLNLFKQMKNGGPAPNSVTLVAALKACTPFALKGANGQDWGKRLHDLAIENGCDSDIYVQNTLIDTYTKCGSMVDARQVFDSMKHPDVVSWTVLILGYAQNGEGVTALHLFTRMKAEGPAPNCITFLAALKACTCFALNGGPSGLLECKERGKGIHDFAVKHGYHSDILVQNTLIDMYGKCNSMVDALQVFDSMSYHDTVSWNTIILGYVDNGEGLTALEFLTRMRSDGPLPDSVTFYVALKVCAVLGGLEFGRTLHSEIESGNHLNLILLNCLVDFYAKCGSLVEAQRLFHLHAETRDVVTWNSLMAGFSSCGDSHYVFELFDGMLDAGFVPDSVTFLSVLTCCSHAGLVDKGKECFESMSSKFKIVPSLKHYNCMIDILGRANRLDDAMGTLQLMSWSPNDVTWTTILGACHKWKIVQMGRLAFRSLVYSNEKETAAYLLMGQIYGSKGMLQEQRMVMEMRKMLQS